MAAGIQSVFVSYTRKDQEQVTSLLQGLRRLGYQVWYDQELSGGQAWWEAILGQIRGCDAVLLAVSPAGLESEACRAEIAYARQVGKAVLPVMVEAVLPALLPHDLAQLQLVDYTGRNPNQVFELLAALRQLPGPAPLPDALPAPPPVPMSYLNRLSQMVERSVLDQDEQFAAVGGIKEALHDPELREGAIDLLRRFNRRKDLFRGPAREVEAMLAEVEPPSPPPLPPPPPVPPQPAPQLPVAASARRKGPVARFLKGKLPSVPILSWMVEKSVLNLDEQIAVVAGIKQALADPELRDGAVALLRRFRQRQQLDRGPAKEVDSMLAELEPPPRPADRLTAAARRLAQRSGETSWLTPG